MRVAKKTDGSEEDDEPLTPWEQDQLCYQRGIRKRLREELALIHRHGGSMVDAFAKHTDVLTHVLAYAWRGTNALMRTCKRFLAVVGSRAYWTELARRAFAGRVPLAILGQVNWFHGLRDDEPAHSYLWSCILSPKSRGYGGPDRIPTQTDTLFLTHFRTSELFDQSRRVLRVRWSKPNPKTEQYWYCLSSFSISADRDALGHHNHWVPIYTIYFNHPRLRRRLYVMKEKAILGLHDDEDDDDDNDFYEDELEGNRPRKPIIDCYTEVWDPISGRTWCGACPLAVRYTDDELGYSKWMPDESRDWGVWKSNI